MPTQDSGLRLGSPLVRLLLVGVDTELLHLSGNAFENESRVRSNCQELESAGRQGECFIRTRGGITGELASVLAGLEDLSTASA